MTAKQEQRRDTLSEYTTIYKHIPEQPEVLKIIYRSKKQITINMAANKDAKIIKLLP